MAFRLRLTVCCLILLTSAGAAAAQQPANTAQQSTGVAQVGDRVITLQDVENAWKELEPAEHAKAMQSLYDDRRRVLDRLIAGMLIEKAAAEQKVTVAQYMSAEVAKRRTAVTPEAIEAFFKANQAQMQGNPLEKVRDSIRQFLEQQDAQNAQQAIVTELRKRADAPVIRVTLDPPRSTVATSPTDPVRGNPAAVVTLVEFSDYQCPYCGRVTPTIAKLRAAYGDRLRVVWKDFPLTDIHPQAFKAAETAHCAGDQGKYWEFHDRLFANQKALDVPALKEHAAAVGLEAAAFGACLDDSRHAARVRKGMDDGRVLGVGSTPTAFVNGRAVVGAVPYETFQAVIEEELARAK